MRFILATIVLCMGIFFPRLAISQTWPHFKHITTDQGLPSNKIYSIAQDKTGFMWFGTDDGLTWFDGINFEIYKHDPNDKYSIPSDYISAIAEDPQTGNIWVGTDNGLTYFDKGKRKFYRNFIIPKNDSTLLKTRVTSMLVKNGTKWIGTFNGLYVFKGESDTALVYENSSSVYSIVEDARGNVWIGTSTGIKLYNRKSNSFVPFGNLQSRIWSVYLDSHNNLWVSTDSEGLFLIRDQKILNFTKEHQVLGRIKVHSMTEDDDGNIYFVLRNDKGLCRFDYKTGQIRIFSPDEYNPASISSSALLSILKDSFGNIWIGTFNNGVDFLDRNFKAFNHYKVSLKPNGLLNNNIRAVFQDSDGDIWIGTKNGGGLSKFIPSSGTFVNYQYNPANPYSLSSRYIFSIGEAKPGWLLVGTFENGLDLFDKKNNRFYHLTHNPSDPKSIAQNNIYALYKDRYNVIWVGTGDQLQTFDFETRTFKIVKGATRIRCFLDYNDELMYMAGTDGLFLYNRRTNTVSGVPLNDINHAQISSIDIYGLVMDTQGNLWIAINRGGICHYNVLTHICTLYTVKHGLSSKNTRSIQIDKNGNLWISTANGLSKFNPDTRKFINYYVADGLQSNSFERWAGLKTKNGYLLFGGNNGFNYFSPDSIKDNLIIPKVVFTNLKIFNKTVRVGEKGSPLKHDISATRELTINHQQTVLTFEFAALNYSVPENNKYAYILEGFEKDWNYVGNRQSATYTNLPYGTFTLRVKASNNNGVWNNEGVTIKITVLPPWWRTWWFNLLAILLLIASTILIIRYRTRHLNLEKQKLEQMVKERTRSIEIQNKQLSKLNNKVKRISEMRLQFFTNVSHEFRTPLSLILGPLEKVLALHTTDDEIKQNLNVIKRNSNRLLNLINELMDFRSIESQNTALHLTHDNIVSYVQEIAGCFNDLAQQRNMDYIINGHQPIELFFDRAIIEKIVYNLISNAFKYTQGGRRVQVEIKLWNKNISVGEEVIGKITNTWNYAEIIVLDNGSGINEENLQRIFSEFYREGKTEAVGSGIGLALTKELVLIHKGFLTVRSRKNEGSAFSVKLPLGKEWCKKMVIEEHILHSLDFSRSQVTQIIDDIRKTEADKLQVENILKDRSKKRELILIVEDNIDLRNFLAHELSSDYNISLASDGEEGYSLAMKQIPDLIISDVLMPKKSGLELCSQLKNESQTCHIPIVLLTSMSEVSNQVSGLESGADDYIGKPFEISVLKARIQNLIKSRNRLRQIFHSSLETLAGEISSNPDDEKFLQKVLAIMDENIANPEFGASELVEKIGISKSVLHERLTKLTSQSAVEFITTVRLKKAAQLMQNSSLTVNEIALMVGYFDASYFGRRFKKQFGKTPTAYIDALNGK